MTDKPIPETQGHLAPAPSAPTERYRGSAWRARFLRAPKIALSLSKREDFVALDVFASVKLGLKTGADSFFFVDAGPDIESDSDLVPRRGVVVVRGLDNWVGEIARADLYPAILNPHQLFVGEDRRFRLPKQPTHFYVCPRPGTLRYGLGEYVRLGELRGIHQGQLVLSNSSDVGWYSQARSLVTSRWILPYNSAYDYGAWLNPDGYVLNGRFVGVDVYDQEHSELIGAVMNSTFAAVGRLTEGVATGVEGAFDVGPPAARKIMIPDIRRFSAKGRAAVLSAFQDIAAADIMPSAPLRDARTPRLRAALDSEILIALGMSAGQAAALLDTLYTSYGRWRGNIEDVEGQMRAHRRQMSATGQTRAQRPVDVAARRVWEEIKHTLPLFPKSFLPAEDILEVVNVPGRASIPQHKPLFDVGVVRTTTKVIDLGSHERLQYVAMLRTLGLVGAVEVPTSHERAGAIAELFEREKVNFKTIASERAASYVSGQETIAQVVEKVRTHWFAACRKSALEDQGRKEKHRKMT